MQNNGGDGARGYKIYFHIKAPTIIIINPTTIIIIKKSKMSCADPACRLPSASTDTTFVLAASDEHHIVVGCREA